MPKMEYEEAAGLEPEEPKKKEERLHEFLSNEEVREIQKKARAKIDAERKESARQDLLSKEMKRLQREEGLSHLSGVQNEIVNITIDLPKFSDRITVNMFPFMHGQTYPVPRHVANSLQEQMSRSWEHERRVIHGETMREYLHSPRATHISAIGGVSNAPSRN